MTTATLMRGCAAMLLLAGCRLGPQAKDFRPANEPGGVTATVRMPSQTLTGELLEVRDSAIVVLGAQVVLVPDRAIERATFADTRLEIYRGYPLTAANRAQLRMLGRYPYGIPAEALSKLLASRNQAAIVVIGQ